MQPSFAHPRLERAQAYEHLHGGIEALQVLCERTILYNLFLLEHFLKWFYLFFKWIVFVRSIQFYNSLRAECHARLREAC